MLELKIKKKYFDAILEFMSKPMTIEEIFERINWKDYCEYYGWIKD